tara:strand:+ start:392 stop:1816 length:1425 start_codon:yes stop_codon:yes gene_type:complete
MRTFALKLLALLTTTTLISVCLTGIASAATPTVPTNLSATAGTNSVVLTWTASANTPTDYIIEYSPDDFSGTTVTFAPNTVSTATTRTVTGLTNGQRYLFRVKGKNGDGTSAASATVSSTPYSNHTPNDLALFDACPTALIPAAGFSDVTSADVSCIKYYGITQGATATTYEPLEFVSRWQMALFLTRLVTATGTTLPNGTGQGFTDISGKSAEIQTAINQIKQLGITIGKTATTFAPDDYVTREEMALFIERLLKAVPVGPGGNEEFVTGSTTVKEIKSLDTDHNFTDLGTVSLLGMQNAIINLWNLGVTEVATATIYEPSVNISRLNMAQMMARALDHTNARPAGLHVQANAYVSASSGNLYISVTNRTSDFKAISGTPIDTFRYLHTGITGYSDFSGDGSCAQTSSTVISITACKIDVGESATDINGNITPWITAVNAGQLWDYWAWTATAGTLYDNDIHGSAASKISIRG